MKQHSIIGWVTTSLFTVFSLTLSGCALTGTGNSTANASAATTNTTTTQPKRQSLRDVADNAMASKGKLSAREINAILKTQSVCRPK